MRKIVELICSDCRRPFTLAPFERPFTRTARGSGPVCPECQRYAGIGVGTQYPNINVGRGYMGRLGGQKGISRAGTLKKGYSSSAKLEKQYTFFSFRKSF
jgi:hypothetical protein